jgi:hypothetical protein
MDKLHSEDSPSWQNGFRQLGSVATCLLIALHGAPPAFANSCLSYQTTTFSLPGSVRPTSINSSGAVAGFDSVGGFVRDPDGTITTLKWPAVIVPPIYINDSGIVAGSYKDNPQAPYSHGFVGQPQGGRWARLI